MAIINLAFQNILNFLLFCIRIHKERTICG